MIEAWLSLSLTTTSPSSSRALSTPTLTVYPLWKQSAASVRLKAASRASSCSWTVWVPGDGAHRAGAGAPLPRPLDGGLDQAGVGVEAEVIVAAQVDQLPAADRHLVPLRELEDPERPEEALLAEPVEVLGERPVERLDGVGARGIAVMA